MIGFRAEVEYAEPVLDSDELEDARWFTREELRDAVVGRRLKMPTRVSISHRLVTEWYQEDPPPDSPDLLAPVVHDGPR
jgi:NAD+ diphosphatase